MELKLSKTQQALLIVALMLTAIPMVVDGVIIPISNNLYEAFPNDTGAVNFILSGPQLLVAISSLAAMPLMQRFSKKSLLVVFGTICAVVLILGAAVDNAYYMAAMRSIAGICTGIINVVGLALFAEVITDEKTYANLMGIYNAFMSLGGTALAFFAGILATGGWKNAYQLFWVLVPCALAFLFFIPKLDSTDAADGVSSEAEDAQAEAPTKGMGMTFWAMMAALALYLVAGMGASYFISVFVAENGLGNEAFAGTASSVMTLGSFIFCLGFGFLYGKLGSKLLGISFACAVVGIAAMVLFPSPATALLGMVLDGGAYGIAYSFVLAYSPEIVQRSQVDKAISIIGFNVAIMSFLATYLVTFLMGVRGSFTATLPVLLAIGVVAVVIAFLALRPTTQESE